MPHPESEHSLMIEVARLQQDLREARAQIGKERDAWVAANVRADAALARAADVQAANLGLAHRMDEVLAAHGAAESALAAARRESTLYRGVIDNLLGVMEMQEKRESGAFHITGEVMFGIWSDAKAEARKALAAPAAASGEEVDKRRGGKPEISMQDVLDNMIDDLSRP